MDEDVKYPEKVQPGMNVKYALNEDDPEEKWEESTVESVQDQPSFVPKGTFCRFVNFRLGYVKKILKKVDFIIDRGKRSGKASKIIKEGKIVKR
mgnify:CR=1 FL=1